MMDGGTGPWQSPGSVFGEDRNLAGPTLRGRNQRFGHRHRVSRTGGATRSLRATSRTDWTRHPPVPNIW